MSRYPWPHAGTPSSWPTLRPSPRLADGLLRSHGDNVGHHRVSNPARISGEADIDKGCPCPPGRLGRSALAPYPETSRRAAASVPGPDRPPRPVTAPLRPRSTLLADRPEAPSEAGPAPVPGERCGESGGHPRHDLRNGRGVVPSGQQSGAGAPKRRSGPLGRAVPVGFGAFGLLSSTSSPTASKPTRTLATGFPRGRSSRVLERLTAEIWEKERPPVAAPIASTANRSGE
jgi:hypothetical protein